MTKKILAAMAFAGLLLVAPSVFATPCTAGATLQFVGVGSSAQQNTLAYAASDALGVGFHLFSVTGKDTNSNNTTLVHDSRPGVNRDDSATTWIMWDGGTTCNVYAYFTEDSAVGVKDFLAYSKITVGGKAYSVQAAYGVLNADVEDSNFSGTECNTAGFTCATGKVGGLPDTDTQVPGSVFLALAGSGSIPANQPPNAPKPHCGVNPNKTPSGVYCYFNAAGTDIRPEDALYATTRALTNKNAALTGLGYNNATCGGDSLNPGKIGCGIFDSFGQGKTFNVLSFKLSGTDPIGTGTIPAWTAFNVGAAPQLVIVNHGDTTAGQGFGDTGVSPYTFHDINRQVLAEVFQGRLHCTTDLLTTGTGVGKPIQAVVREPLSGTYNTFEFTGVRVLYGSGNPFTSAPTTTAAKSNADSSQEEGNDPTIGHGLSGCPANGSTVPTASCGDPLYQLTGSNNTGGCGQGVKLRSIGSGEEVAATVNTYGGITDGIGYTFWSFGNLSPLATGCGSSTNQNTYNGACNFIGHYLTVDGIDPLYATPGGANDSPANPAGAYNPPQCNFKGLPCLALPFTHVKDGTYPLWSVLRIMSFANVGSGNAATLLTPPAVINMIAFDQQEVANSSRRTGDFVPFLTNLANSGTLAAPSWTGDLNLFVFRSHYKAAGDPNSPLNGHKSCITSGVADFTSVALGGGTSTSPACLVDKGNDMGGAVLTVQSDVDWNIDAGSPAEQYNLRQ